MDNNPVILNKNILDRYNEIKGALKTLKELQKFTNWQKEKVNYEMYLIHNSTSDFIDIEVESFI